MQLLYLYYFVVHFLLGLKLNYSFLYKNTYFIHIYDLKRKYCILTLQILEQANMLRTSFFGTNFFWRISISSNDHQGYQRQVQNTYLVYYEFYLSSLAYQRV